MNHSHAERLIALIQFIEEDLTEYKNQVDFESTIVNGIKNDMLCGARANNIKNTLANLQAVKEKIFKESYISNYDQYIGDLKKIITTSQYENKKLSIQYGYTHRSYTDNRLSGLSIFSSWAHKTFFQSRAAVKLEQAFKHIEKLEKALNPSMQYKM